MPRPRKPSAARTPLSRERVLDAAIALADAEGIKGLSMRKLAQQLGVEAMSLYNHVANKADLLDAMVESVAGQVDLARDAPDWKSGMRRRILSAHDVLARHPWAPGLWMSGRSFSPARVGYADAILRGLREGGFSEDHAYHVFHVLQSHLLGFTLQESNSGFDAAQIKELAASFLQAFPADDYPDMAVHIRQHIEPSAAHSGTFAFGLDLILDGLERLRDGA